MVSDYNSKDYMIAVGLLKRYKSSTPAHTLSLDDFEAWSKDNCIRLTMENLQDIDSAPSDSFDPDAIQ